MRFAVVNGLAIFATILMVGNIASAISLEERNDLKSITENFLINSGCISHVDVNITSNNVIEILAIPIVGSTDEETGRNVILSYAAIDGVYIGVYEKYPEIDLMNSTIYLNNTPLVTFHCLGEWAAMVRKNPDGSFNRDDVEALNEKVRKTGKVF